MLGAEPAIERHWLWPFDPWAEGLPAEVAMPQSREAAADLLRNERDMAGGEVPWAFSDGSVKDRGAGAAVLWTCGNRAAFKGPKISGGGTRIVAFELRHPDGGGGDPPGIRVGWRARQGLARGGGGPLVIDSQASILVLYGWRTTAATVVSAQ